MTPTDAQIERAARAIFDSNENASPPARKWDNFSDDSHTKAEYRRMARAVAKENPHG